MVAADRGQINPGIPACLEYELCPVPQAQVVNWLSDLVGAGLKTVVPAELQADHVAMDKIATVRWMSWNESLSEEIGEKTAVIQILNPGMAPFQLGVRRQLVLSFWDRIELTFGETILAKLFGGRPSLCVRLYRLFFGDNGGWPWRPPLADDAEQIRKFVDEVPEGWSFLVTCEYGRSRSRAVAEWIALHRKIKIVGDRSRGTANVLLADLLFRDDARVSLRPRTK